MKIGVVFGTFNRLLHLVRAVESVRKAQGSLDVEIIVVDGGSTDGSLEFLSEQSDVTLIRQIGPLTGAVRAFNHGFAHAVECGMSYVVHFNDDAEFVCDAGHHPIERAVHIMQNDGKIGEVAFEFDLRGGWQLEQVHNRIYGNFGCVRTEAGMAVAKAQGDPQGKRWWNPIYKTYGADCEFGMWLWHLGWKIHAGHGLRVHDVCVHDALREANEAGNPNRQDSAIFWRRWRDSSTLDNGPYK